MSNPNLDYRWINDPYERPEAEKAMSETYRNNLAFSILKKWEATPESLFDQEYAAKYSAWLKANP